MVLDLSPFTAVAHSAGDASSLADQDGSRFIAGMPEELYHARPEISASGLKVLRRSPKAFQHSRTVRVEKVEFDVGHAVHSRVLGVGLPIARIPAEILSGPHMAIQSQKAKDYVSEARAAGKVPLKPATYEHVVRASDAVLRHPKAGPLMEATAAGLSEVSMFAQWPGADASVRVRGRADRVHDLDIIDLKTTTDLSTLKLQRAVVDFGYDVSAEMYRLLFELVTGQVANPMTLVFTEKEPPYDVRVVVLEDEWIDFGWGRLREAMDRYADCVTSGVWPGIDDDPAAPSGLPVPGWVAAINREGASNA